MNLSEIYEKQYSIAKIKLNEKKEESWSDWLDRQQNRADIASLGTAGVALGSAATGVGAPVGAVASLASAGIDIANALAYGGRAIHSLATGDSAKAKEHAFSAGLRALFAVPFLGDMAQAGKAIKTAGSAEKAVATAARSAPEVAAAAAATRGARRVIVPAGRGAAPPRTRPSRVPGKTTTPPVTRPSRTAPVARGVGKAATAAAAKQAARTGAKGMSRLGKAAAAVGAGVVAKTLMDKATGAGESPIPGGLSPGDPSNRIYDTRSPVGVDLSRLGIFDTGDAAMPSQSSSSNPQLMRSKFHPMFALSPRQREELRMESYDPEANLKSKVKSAVTKYLNSPQGYKLNKHLESIRKNLTSE